jgi:hypothetical protein
MKQIKKILRKLKIWTKRKKLIVRNIKNTKKCYFEVCDEMDFYLVDNIQLYFLEQIRFIRINYSIHDEIIERIQNELS